MGEHQAKVSHQQNLEQGQGEGEFTDEAEKSLGKGYKNLSHKEA